jgi:hypothetical protein
MLLRFAHKNPNSDQAHEQTPATAMKTFTTLFLLALPSITEGSSKKRVRSRKTSENASHRQLTECDANSEQTRADYVANVEQTWEDPSCYTFKITRDSFGPPESRGPFLVKVKNGKVVNNNPNLPYDFPTMNELMDQVYQNCVATCPDSGAAKCDIVYGPGGSLKLVDIDLAEEVLDEEIRYTIGGFRKCKRKRRNKGCKNQKGKKKGCNKKRN